VKKPSGPNPLCIVVYQFQMLYDLFDHSKLCSNVLCSVLDRDCLESVTGS